MDHAAAQNLQPSGSLADLALRIPAGTEKAAHVDFGGRLGELKITGAEADFDVAAEQHPDELLQSSLQMRKIDAAIHQQSFHLMEHGGVRGVRIVFPEYLSWSDDLNGRR